MFAAHRYMATTVGHGQGNVSLVRVAGSLPFRTATDLLEKMLRKRHRTSHEKL
jgi:hypothetical protein